MKLLIIQLSDMHFENTKQTHHSIEWLKPIYKDNLREIITKKYSLVLSGHEHI